MKGNLVIVESPAKAGTIQKFLGEGYTVKPSFGHIRDLQDKSLSVNVEAGFVPEYVIPADKKKVVSDLKKAASSAEMVWLASDDDREGEAISWHLSQTLGLDPARTRRIAFHEITKPAILDAINNPRDIDMNLVDAQQARRVLDRLVGFEMSPLLWRKIQKGLSAGRVQSVALRLVVDREKEIMAFNPVPYYRVEAVFRPEGAPASVKVKGTLDAKFPSREQAEGFLKDSIGASYTVSSVEKKEGVRLPAAPFTTSTLQQEASRRLHFSVNQTMRIAQALYERGLITYMRTDSTNLSGLALGTAKQFITDNFGPEYSNPRQYKTKSKGAQEAHEAIRPTYISNTAVEGTPQEQKLYNLIWKRTVASQMSEAKVLGTSVKVGVSTRPELYSLTASQVLFDGFLKLYLEASDDETEDGDIPSSLPELCVGNRLEAKDVAAECKFTQPPFRYSEATLVKKLEELGIGRPSTFGPTIGTLTTGRGYIVKGDKEGRKVDVVNLALKNGNVVSSAKTEVIGAEKGKLLPQEIGIIVTDYLVENFPEVMSYDFTASVEKDFDKVADGEMPWKSVISGFYSPFHKKVDTLMRNREYSRVSREIGADPSDGQMIVARFGQFGAYVQKGEGESRQFANLGKGQLIETLTLEEAVRLFEFPRNLGELDGTAVTILKGRYGPYIKYGDRNVSLPRGTDPLHVSLEECASIIGATQEKSAPNPVVAEYAGRDIQVINGRYGLYIKHAGANYKIPKGTPAEALTEEKCLEIVSSTEPTAHSSRKFTRRKK